MDDINITDSVRAGIAMIDATEHDGHPFGLPPGAAADSYVLTAHPGGAISLHRVTAGVAGDRLTHVEAIVWSKAEQIILDDFNHRLAAKGMPMGRWPSAGGIVQLHTCFGRELELAMLALAHGIQTATVSIATWARMNGRERMMMRRAIHKVRPIEDAVRRLDAEAKRLERMDAGRASDAEALQRLVRGAYAGDTDEEMAQRRQLRAEAMSLADERRKAAGVASENLDDLYDRYLGDGSGAVKAAA